MQPKLFVGTKYINLIESSKKFFKSSWQQNPSIDFDCPLTKFELEIAFSTNEPYIPVIILKRRLQIWIEMRES